MTSFRTLKRPLAAVIALLSWLAACSPVEQARLSLQAGDPVRAVHFYERAVQRDPADGQLAAELASARAEAGDLLARRAQAALLAGGEEPALRLARDAASFDPTHRTTEIRIRHTVARRHLQSARRSLARDSYEQARREAQHARSIAHDLPETAEMIRQVDEAQARALADDALSYAEIGALHSAYNLARQAADLQPEDEEIAALPAKIDGLRRNRAFVPLYAAARDELSTGRLAHLQRTLRKLAELDIRQDDVAEIAAAAEDRQRRFDATVNEARAARDAGDLNQALRLYAAACRLVTDREDIKTERQACETDSRIAALLRAGTDALEAGRWDEADDRFALAYAVQPDEQNEKRIRQVQTDFYRRTAYQALDEGDRITAIRRLNALRQLAPDEATETILWRLCEEHVRETLAGARRLHEEGRTDAAIDALDAALADVRDQRLIDLRAELAGASHQPR